MGPRGLRTRVSSSPTVAYMGFDTLSAGVSLSACTACDYESYHCISVGTIERDNCFSAGMKERTTKCKGMKGETPTS